MPWTELLRIFSSIASLASSPAGQQALQAWLNRNQGALKELETLDKQVKELVTDALPPGPQVRP